MAEDALESEFFLKLFKVVREILSPAIDLFSDDEAKTELFTTLGLNSNADVDNLPTTTNLDQYIATEAGKADAVMLAGALHDITQLTLAIEGAIRAGLHADEDNPEFVVDEIFHVLLNMLLMDYLRRRNPVLYSVITAVSTITHKTVEIGGNIGFAKVIGDFFQRLGGGFESEENIEAQSQVLFGSLVGSLYFIFDCLLDDIDSVSYKTSFGYEGISDESPTPNADGIANRTLSYSLTVRPFDSLDNQATLFNSITLVPEDHGGLALVTDLSGEVDTTLPVSDDISFKIDAAGDGIFRVGNSSASVGPNNRAKITFQHKRDKAGLVKVFPNPEIRLGLKKYSFAVSLSPEDFDIKFSGKLPFRLNRKKDASFPLSLLPKEIKEEIPLDFGYSIQRDFYFGSGGGNAGSTAGADTVLAANAVKPDEQPSFVEKILAKLINLIDLRLPLHQDIKIGTLQVLNIKTGVTGNFEALALETSIDFTLKFGSVLTIAISRLGAKLELIERDDNAGFFGYNLEPTFKPPTGAGISIDTGVAKGGGFLYFDDQKGEYFGAIELKIKDFLALKAIGLINTKLPDGGKGFSMLVLITAEGLPKISFFGFTLDGVGGLLGLDRTVEVEALRIGVRTNAIKSILFPEDVVGNISRIISDIRDFFPVKEDQFIVGLMAKIGYGGIKGLSIELGVIVEWPDPKVIILGVIRVAAPDPDKDALKLQVNFLGLIDFQNEFAYFEAHLYDSHLVGFPLTGSLAFVLGWGDNGLFAISVGGFHPDFKDYPTVPTLPGAFREMTRIGFKLLSGDNPSLTVECYVAITSNSIQFGAKLELLASGPMGFNLYGMLGLDALFIRDPFSFKVALEATLAIRKGRKILFGISFKGLLEGPKPWHCEGEVTFGLLFFDVTIGFCETWGDPLEEIPTTTADLVAMMRRELREQHNWQVEMSQGLHQTVTHRALDDPGADEIVIYPFGQLNFSQRTLPLNYAIEKFGDRRPLNQNKISIDEVRVGDTVQAKDNLKELFAAGHFTKLTEKEKLSRKSFEKFDSGFTLKDTGKLLTAVPDLDPVDLDYELNYTADDEPDTFIFGIAVQAFRQMNRKAAVSKSELGWAQSKDRVLNRVEKVELSKQNYSIARTSDLKEFDGAFRAATLTEAKAHLDALVAGDPSLEEEIQIVEPHELVG